MTPDTHSPLVAVIGGGPAGLMAAETLSGGGARVALYDAMPSVGRKFLLAGKGGMNLTHAEPQAAFLGRYGGRRAQIAPWLEAFGPVELRAWAQDLGVETFVGTSGRVFPVDMKAAPLLRAWLQRLRARGVRFHVRHRWLGWTAAGALRFATPDGEVSAAVDAVVLALGGGSWARLGSDGAWLPLLAGRGVAVAPLRPSNCGFDVGWSEHFRTRFAGQPVKPVVVSCADAQGRALRQQGEFVVTGTGVEGGVIYALSAPLRDRIESEGTARIELDLVPGRDVAQLGTALARPRGRHSLANHLRRQAGIAGVKAGLVRECVPAEVLADPARLAAVLKALPLRLIAPRPLDEAISSAGGVRFEALDAWSMLRALPGVFCAGEMLDWEAPTGGYLLTACFASGRAAGAGALAWLRAGASRGLSPVGSAPPAAP
jgi:uncharacterized flavoprotein (TIGR03862 family)